MKGLSIEEREAIIAEATKRAESKRPKEYIKVIDKEEDKDLLAAQELTDNLTNLIPEEIRELFRIEFGSKLRIIKKKEGPNVLIIPKAEATQIRIVEGIVQFYRIHKEWQEDKLTQLIEILNGIPNITIQVKNKKPPTKTKVSKSREPKRDIDKQDILFTTGKKTILLADICKEANIDPKKARIKLRKHFNKPLAGWQWSIDQKDEIINFLLGK